MEVQGIGQGSIRLDRLDPAGTQLAPQDSRVKGVAGLFVEYLEQMDGPVIPLGEGPPQFVGFKEDEVHREGIPCEGFRDKGGRQEE